MKKYAVLSVVGLLVLTGCDRTKEVLGLNRHVPDEFSVMQRAPLEIPSDLSTLPVPQPGMARPQDTTAVTQAQEVILGKPSPAAADEVSSAESSLLDKAGATQVPSDIRNVVNREAADSTNANTPVVKKLLNLGSSEPGATVVDPVKEAERLKENKESGQPVTTGVTPTIEQ